MLQLRREGTLIQTRNTLKPRTIIAYMHACLLACLLAAFVWTYNVLHVYVYSVATAYTKPYATDDGSPEPLAKPDSLSRPTSSHEPGCGFPTSWNVAESGPGEDCVARGLEGSYGA